MKSSFHKVDGAASRVEDQRQAILDDLLYFFPGPYTMLSVYIDESGTHGNSTVTCVAALFYERDAIKQLDQDWKEALDRVGIDVFHAKDYAKRIKQIGKEKEDSLHKELIEVIGRHAAGGSVAFVTGETQFERCRKSRSWRFGQYTTCAFACIDHLLEKFGAGRDFDFLIEAGHKDQGELAGLFKTLTSNGYPGTYGFRDKKDVRPLQTADLWAYESRKRVADARDVAISNPDGSVRLRQSLKALIEKVPNLETKWLLPDCLLEVLDRIQKLRKVGTDS